MDPADSLGVSVEVVIQSPRWDALPEAEAIVERAAQAALRWAGVPLLDGAELAVALGDDAQVRALNARFRNKDAATNVLSFPAAGPAELRTAPLLGDVILAYETLAREAGEEGRPLPHHLAHLVVHGVLHILGHDHHEDSEAEAMEALETRILAHLGVPDPYADAAPDLDAAPALPERRSA